MEGGEIAAQRRLITNGSEADDVEDLARRLKALRGGPGYEVESQTFEGKNHLSVTPASVTRALQFAMHRPRP